MTEERIRKFELESLICGRKQIAFGDAAGLSLYTFDRDNGSVPKLAEARRYAAKFEAMRQENIVLIFWGQPGNGKTFAAACIAIALCEQLLDIRMTTLGAFLNHLPGLPLQEKERYLRSLIQCDLLLLDDFGMERRTDYAQEQVYGLINGRYLAKKPMIVTTNLSLNDLKSPETITEQRIYDRVLEMCVPICFEGGSLRREMAKEKLRTYKELTR